MKSVCALFHAVSKSSAILFPSVTAFVGVASFTLNNLASSATTFGSKLLSGHCFVVDADLKGYFDTIPHDQLMERVKEKIADGPVLKLIESFLKADIMSGTERWTPEKGAPQGAVLSPLLSNIYLNPLDHLIAKSGFQMVRYADDFVILCKTMEEAQREIGRAHV
mgnify:CR=1 FL=1